MLSLAEETNWVYKKYFAFWGSKTYFVQASPYNDWIQSIGTPDEILFAPDCKNYGPEEAEDEESDSDDDSTEGNGFCIDDDRQDGKRIVDMDGLNCDEYAAKKWWCGEYDNDNFKSEEICCACGGGIRPGYVEEAENAKFAAYLLVGNAREILSILADSPLEIVD